MTSKGIVVPPTAPRRTHHHRFGRVEGENRGEKAHEPAILRSDPYNWMRDDKRERPEVLHYIKQENLYCESKYEEEGLDKLQEELYKENLSHYKEDDITVPVPEGDWFYYSKTLKGKGYKVHCRRQRSLVPNVQKSGSGTDSFTPYPFSIETGCPVGPEMVLFDVNQMAEGHPSYYFSEYEPSHDHSMIAYSVDEKGNEVYDIRFKTCEDGKPVYEDCISGVGDVVVWSRSGEYVFYVGIDAALRPYQVFVHKLGTKQDEDILLYEDNNEEFRVSISQTSSKRYLKVRSQSSEETEIRILDLDRFDELCKKKEQKKEGCDFKSEASSLLSIVAKRQDGILYQLDHWKDYLLIVTNKDDSMEGKLCVCQVEDVGRLNGFECWRDVFKYDSSVHLERVHCFSNYFVLSGREDGSSQLWIVKPDMVINNIHNIMEFNQSTEVKKIEMPELCYSCGPDFNKEFNTKIFRYEYESFTTPKQVIEYDMSTNQLVILRTVEVPNYNRSDYDSTKLDVPSHDGKFNIPVSLVWKRQFFPDGLKGDLNAPLVLLGYGSYGISNDPEFHFDRLVFTNRGYVVAIAHIRGGAELGRFWYETEGKFLSKKNTFYDFIACIEFLQQRGITTPKKTAIIGRSAGGLLIGTCLNLRPDLVNVAIADVPFVDVLNTTADASIPLTVGEWKEWGNPNQLKFFYYLLEYSPYDTIQMQSYPNLLVTCGLNDPRVPYWEATKYVAKLRAMKTDDNLLLLKTDMSAGHFSQSDRYRYIKECSFEQAFVVHCLSGEAGRE